MPSIKTGSRCRVIGRTAQAPQQLAQAALIAAQCPRKLALIVVDRVHSRIFVDGLRGNDGMTKSDPRRWRLIRPTLATRGARSRSEIGRASCRGRVCQYV